MPSAPQSHFWPEAAYAAQPSARTSTGIAPAPWAPSRTTGTSSSASAAGATSPVTHDTCEQATSVVRAVTASGISCSGTAVTRTPRPRAAISGPTRPGCSLSDVTISSPAPSSSPASTTPRPSLVEVVRATSFADAFSTRAYSSRSSP